MKFAPTQQQPNKSWQWIERDHQLEALLPTLAQADALAVDLESDSFYAYIPRICLIQIATPDDLFILDPLQLSKKTIQKLQPLFADETRLKVFHGCDNDLFQLWNTYQIQVRGLFDTLLAARFLNLPKRGLGDLLARYFQAKTSKRFQRFDWSTRPLPADALEYAAQDIRYLLLLHEILEQALHEQGRLEAVYEESMWLSQRNFTPKPFDPYGYLRIKGAKSLSAKEQNVLYALYMWRHQRCLELNRAAFMVLDNASLLSLARHQPHSEQALYRTPRISARQVRLYKDELLEVIAKGRHTPAPKRPHQPRNKKPTRSPQEQAAQAERTERLRAWRKAYAQQEQFEIDLVLTNLTLQALAETAPASLDDLLQIPGMLPWRVRRFGQELLDLLHAPL